MKEPSSILVTIKFSFAGLVSHEELQKAIGRALNTKQFRLVGQYTILDMSDEIMVEVPKKPFVDRAPLAFSEPTSICQNGPTGPLGPIPVDGGGSVIEIGLKR